jgi:serine/threonine-protein kinase
VDDWLGRILDERYRVDACIGRGGMGVVYRGTHLELGKRVAIKRLDARLSREVQAYERFRREAVAASRIESPYVVQVFDWGKGYDNSPFIVMELLEGKSLRRHFEQEGRLIPLEAARIAAQILKGLQRIHQANVLHRDLKPENVFLCEYDHETTFVKLLDFGISKSLEPYDESNGVTGTGEVLGTAAYMSPEQAHGERSIDGRSDLYSLGAVLYEALTGNAPHTGRTYAAMLVDICTRDADDVRVHGPLIPEALAQVVSRALKRDKELRFPTATDFLDALLGAMPTLQPKYEKKRATLTPTQDGTLEQTARAIDEVSHAGRSVVTSGAFSASSKPAPATSTRDAMKTDGTPPHINSTSISDNATNRRNGVSTSLSKKTRWGVGVLAALATFAAVTHWRTRFSTTSNATPPLSSKTLSTTAPDRVASSSSVTSDDNATSPSSEVITETAPRSSRSVKRPLVLPSVTRQFTPASASNTNVQSGAGVAGSLKLRRTMP